MLGLLLALLLLGAPSTTMGQSGRAAVRLDGVSLFRVAGTEEIPAASRARDVERRLAVVLEDPTLVTDARVSRSPASPAARVVEVAGVPIVTVTEADAEASGSHPAELADRWASLLDAELAAARARRHSLLARLVADATGATKASLARLGESATHVLPRVLAAALVLGAFWPVARGVRAAARWIAARATGDRTRAQLVAQLASYAAWAVGLLVAGDALGFAPTTIITGLGLTGIVLGFALKDVLSNVVSGLLLLALRTFRLGDQVIVGDSEGSVERITLRATEIRTYDGRLVLVPNAQVFTSPVVNNTASAVRRGSVTVPVGYDADLRAACGALEHAMAASEGVLADRPSSVVVKELGADDVLLECRFWSDSLRSDFLATHSAVRRAAVAALGEAGVSLPDPAVRRISMGVAEVPPGRERGRSPRRDDAPIGAERDLQRRDGRR